MSAITVPRPRWLTESGPENDVVLSTRCRIARNLRGEPFPWRAEEGPRKRISEAILDAARRAGGALSRAIVLSGNNLEEETATQLLLWQLISLDWKNGGSHRWLLIAPDGVTSLMIHEEDHLRLQAISAGLQVELLQRTTEKTVRSLATVLEFAAQSEVGYLTASLANAGTGLRISALLHLAGLAVSETRESVLEAAIQMGCSVRGLYGEGTFGTGELFQVSNTYTFGLTPSVIADRVSTVARYLMEAERKARQEHFRTPAGRAHLETAVREALRCLFLEEATTRRLLPLVSILRLAVTEGALPGDLAESAEWVALAGVEAAQCTASNPTRERFEAVRRSAALRQRLRAYERDA